MTVAIGGNTRALYSSAWIGMVLALMASTMLSLVGFYLVRGTLVRDFETRVWQLLVATPMTRSGYLLAKWASQLMVFAVLMGVAMVVGLFAQWWRAEDTGQGTPGLTNAHFASSGGRAIRARARGRL